MLPIGSARPLVSGVVRAIQFTLPKLPRDGVLAKVRPLGLVGGVGTPVRNLALAKSVTVPRAKAAICEPAPALSLLRRAFMLPCLLQSSPAKPPPAKTSLQ